MYKTNILYIYIGDILRGIIMGLTITTTYLTGKCSGKTVTERINANPYTSKQQTTDFCFKFKAIGERNPYYATANQPKAVTYQPKQETYIAKNDAIKTPVRYTQADAFVTNNAKNDLERVKAEFDKVKRLYTEASVNYIIETDKHKPKSTDTSRIANKIIDAANYAGVDADSIACIVKRESHFKETGLNVYTGKGPMGLTSIAVKDLYVRPQIFDTKLKSLVKEYGSLSKVFAAKKSNPSLNLGNLGNILYQHGSWTSLNRAIKKDYDLNLKVGAYIFKYQLNRAMANKNISIANKEQEAFKNYNNSYLKNSYASSSNATLKAARASALHDEKYLAALNKVHNGKLIA